jgi:hypothetical protein
MKNKEKTPYEKWIGRKTSLSYLRTCGCLAKVNAPINKKRKLKLKNVYVDTLLESRDVTFFKNIFL